MEAEVVWCKDMHVLLGRGGGLVIGQSLRRIRSDQRQSNVHKRCVDWSLRVSTMCLDVPTDLNYSGGTQQPKKVWFVYHCSSHFLHYGPMKRQSDSTRGSVYKPSTVGFLTWLLWVPQKIKFRVSLVYCNMCRTHLPMKFKIWPALQT